MVDFQKLDKKTVDINFQELDWKTVDKEKMEYFYNEAQEYNDKLIDDLNSLNNKAFSLLDFALPVFTAVCGLLVAMWENQKYLEFKPVLIMSCIGFVITVVLLTLAIFPKNIFRTNGTPSQFFSGKLYKAKLEIILSGGIASFYQYIKHNRKIMRYRTNLLTAGTIAFISVPLLSIIVFLLSRRS